MTVNIGELKHRITFWQESNVSDGQGGYVTTWSQLANAWAKAVEQTPRERFYRGEDAHTQGVTFTIRQPQTFALDTRTSDNLKIVHRGIDYRIVGIGRNKFNLDFCLDRGSNPLSSTIIQEGVTKEKWSQHYPLFGVRVRKDTTPALLYVFINLKKEWNFIK